MTQFSQLSKEVADNEKLVTMKTTMGEVKIKLFPEVAPKTVENFLGLAKKGFYDGVIFHRVIPEFMIQGGDPTGTGMGGESLWGDSFEDEFSKEVFNLYGTLSMANAGPNTNGSQFFIVTAPDGTPWLDSKHTVFGQVIEGMDVVESIQNVKRGPQDKPVNDVVIETIELG